MSALNDRYPHLLIVPPGSEVPPKGIEDENRVLVVLLVAVVPNNQQWRPDDALAWVQQFRDQEELKAQSRPPRAIVVASIDYTPLRVFVTNRGHDASLYTMPSGQEAFLAAMEWHALGA